jgi:hypothetical protein
VSIGVASDSDPAFISELARAANEIAKLTPTETTRLMQRAAASIRDYRDEIAFSGTPANDTGQGDIVFELNAMASAVDLFSPDKVSAMLLEAGAVIKACKILLDEKRRIET